jgi:antitoxin component YwqK of YwqJK toxin-antitoxin module
LQRITLLLITLLSFATKVSAQDTLRYFVDYYNKKCSRHLAYFYRVQIREGNLWYIEDYYAREQIPQMTGRYADDSLTKAEGTFYYYHKNSKLDGVVRYKNGLLEGLSMHYDSTGRVLDSTFYKHGQPSGYSFGWAGNGRLNYRGIFDEEGKGAGEAWHYHDNGNLCCYGKKSVGNEPDSVWTYYYREGGISSKETYTRGKFKKQVCYDPGDSTRPVKCKENPSSRRAFVRSVWKKFVSEEDAFFQCRDELKGRKGRLILDVCVDIDGKLSASVIQPFYPCVDDLMIKLLTGTSTKPIIEHNRYQTSCETIPFDL